MQFSLKTIVIILLCQFAVLSQVAAREKIQFVYFDQFEPFSWSENGQMKGLFVDVVNRVFHQLGMEVEHHGYPWKRAQMLVEHGRADGMCTISTARRQAYTLATDYPLVRLDFRIFTGAANPRMDQLKQVKTIDDLQGFRLVDIFGSGWADTNLKGMDLCFEHSYPAMFRALKDGVFDAAVRNDVQTRYLIKKYGYADALVALPQSLNLQKVGYRILIAKQSRYAEHMDRINLAIKKIIDDGTLLRIHSRYR